MIILIEISDFYIKFTHRTFTSAFIRDVDYAFKGENKRNYVYWASHLSMLCFFIMRSLLVLNTPDVVHVPRITLNEETLNNEYYQFRNDLYEDLKQKYQCQNYLALIQRIGTFFECQITI